MPSKDFNLKGEQKLLFLHDLLLLDMSVELINKKSK